MLSVVSLVVALAGVPVALAALYLLSLTITWRRPAAIVPDQTRRFCILVPAHNEALGIGRTIASLQSINYPAALRRIIVLADNCTDDTARIARARGAEVMERHDAERRGKGQALQYGIDRLLAEAPDAWDALVVVDADTQVSDNLLEVASAHLARGAEAVQVLYRPRAAAMSPTAVITDVAFAAFHLVRSGARERLGLSCGLRGNGMVFTRSVLRDVPHQAFTRTEDLEFGILLGLHGIRVAFAGQTVVYGDMPDAAAVVTQQRERWIGGRFALAKRFAGTLLKAAVARRSLMLADLACDLVVPPVSALVVLAGLGLVISLILSVWTGLASPALLVWSLAVVALGVHVMHAASAVGRTGALIRATLAVPAYAWGKATIAWRGLRPTADVWIRTTREGEQS